MASPSDPTSGVRQMSAMTASKVLPASRSAASCRVAALWTSNPAPEKWDW